MLTASLVGVIVACSMVVPENERFQSKNRKYALEVSAKGKLALVGPGAKRLWAVERPWTMRQYVIAEGGEWVALIESEPCNCPEVTILGRGGRQMATAEIIDLLSEEERQHLDDSTCGVNWISNASAAKDALVLNVIQGGSASPLENQGPTLRLAVNTLTGSVTRDQPVARPDVNALIEKWNKSKDSRVVGQLLQKAELSTAKGDPTLRAFFRARLEDRPDPLTVAMSAQALAKVGDTADLAAIAAMGRAKGGDPIVALQVLTTADPPAAAAFALESLREKREPELLRQRAVVALVRDKSAQWVEAAKLGLADTEKVRDLALQQLAGMKPSPEAAGLLLPLAASDTSPPALHARRGLLRYLDVYGKAHRALVMDQIDAGKLQKWGGSHIVAGGVAEVRGDRNAAAAHYRRGLAIMDQDRLANDSRSPDVTLWCEAKLRLAAFAAAEGNKIEARALVDEVKRSGASSYVRAPAPNEYAGGPGSVGRHPGVVADEIAKRL